MKIIKSLLLLSIGTGFGVGMVLSCTNDSPRRSDAATCDCPASESPIPGRVVSIDSNLVTVGPNAQGAAAGGCDPGMQFLSGSCTAEKFFLTFDDVTLQQAGFDKASNSWVCIFKNNKTVPVQVKASVLCLKPAT